MLGLGKQVLRKIENLLVQVDKKRPNPFNHPKQQPNLDKSKSKSKQKPQTSRIPIPTHRKNNTTHQVEADKENVCSHRIQQLYLNHFVKEKRLLDRNLLNMQHQMRQFRNFKVQNKTSQYLNKKKTLKPIYQRTPEIIKNKQKCIEKIKQSVPKNYQPLQEDEQAALEQVRKRHPKLTKQEFQRRMHQMEQRNLLRMEKLQKKKLQQLAAKSIIFNEKPQLPISNSVWWEKKRLKKNLSNNVLQRFSQYDVQKRQKWEKYLQRRKEEQTPFTPRISYNTKQIAKKSLSRRSLMENIPRSLSCRALSKREQSIVSFIEKIEREEKTDRKCNESIDKSLSRNITHGKSVATMSSSRNALVQRRFN